MSKKSEAVLEAELITKLIGLGYENVKLSNEEDMLLNLKKQLEIHNDTTFSNAEFRKILNHLSASSVVKRAKILRDRYNLKKDDGTDKYIDFLNMDKWCQNEYQVSNQITMQGRAVNRYDVTLLVNGLPLVQIELKRSGVALKDAFNQVDRYQKDSFWASRGLFGFVQLFVISNSVNTRYFTNFADNSEDNTFKQTFSWTTEKNKHINDLGEFTSIFLEPCFLSKMICKYIVVSEVSNKLMVLRPYQYYAVENIVNQVNISVDGGYIWHTTGSGKTLTSFKTSQILKDNPNVKKILFVVDRKDLDYQTALEFNNFKEGSVDSTDNTSKLIKQLCSNTDDSKLIVTTIQKLNNAITTNKYLKQIEHLKDEKIVFIFDECHRSQFGDTHNKISEFFHKKQMFGFTGTPIFEDNSSKNHLGRRTTKDLFGERLHTYVIKDAINDENVLKFSVEYVADLKNKIDIESNKIDEKALMEAPRRLEKISDYILGVHLKKTHQRRFTAILCTSSVDCAIAYYDLFKKKKEEQKHNLNIATIFSYAQNEESKESFGILDEEKLEINESKVNYRNKEKLELYINDFNETFGTNHSLGDTQSYYRYYNDIATKVKKREVDILIVVNMFLTGFDSRYLNTIYVDKNLRFHGLIQAYSRTNRTLDEVKSQGNVVCFRNLKDQTDEAIGLFNDEEANEVITKEDVLMKSYAEYTEIFAKAVDSLYEITPNVQDVDALADENEEYTFISAFREIMRLKNSMASFSDFSWDDLGMSEEEFTDFSTKYTDLRDKIKRNKDKTKPSIFDEIDFELELLHTDEINVAYILALLANMRKGKKEGKDYEKQKKAVIDMIVGDSKLRSKRVLIEKFIDKNLFELEEDSNVKEAYDSFLEQEQTQAMNILCEEENLNKELFQKMISKYIFKKDMPRGAEILGLVMTKLKLKEKKEVEERVKLKINDFIEIFFDGMK
ncbi:type I restriction endonuclease subunit R [Poseidonibacter lekithochrous]|uniref:type I restriction endonuclease subunit R n=1 Tax=Poseidonibacter lekithochrous TaxID=1904463 RepID=UPI0008FC9185|nr:type I restriction endonuclease subunit R [Poseidonibacter lekithochrous]QKJ24524.1 type I restriction/modification system, restriction subunit [Poseidonibacter lekithochrous]